MTSAGGRTPLPLADSHVADLSDRILMSARTAFIGTEVEMDISCQRSWFTGHAGALQRCCCAYRTKYTLSRPAM